MNLSDWLDSLAAADGDRFEAAGETWKLGRRVCVDQLGGYTVRVLVNEEDENELMEGMWADLPSCGWSKVTR